MSSSSKDILPHNESLIDEQRTLVAAGVSDSDEAYLDHLRSQGYVIEHYQSAQGLQDYIVANVPNVLLLDMDGLGKEAIKITRYLKENPLTYTMPIIIVMGQCGLNMEIQALEAGAEDFIHKPFNQAVLAARIATSMKRNIRLQISNPLTGLPGATYIEEQTTKRLEQGIPVAFCYTDLNQFKAYNDYYGYRRGDNVIRILATILNEGVSMFGKPGDFVGHIGGDDFILVINYNSLEQVCNYVTNCFDILIPYQYDEKDRKKGYIISTNRQGQKMRFQIMTVSIGIVSNENNQINNYLIITEYAAEMKEYAKTISLSAAKNRSVYRVDKRTS